MVNHTNFHALMTSGTPFILLTLRETQVLFQNTDIFKGKSSGNIYTHPRAQGQNTENILFILEVNKLHAQFM